MDNKSISRRSALRKLGLGLVAGYIVPEMLMVSTAAAASEPSEPSEPSAPSAPSQPSPASEPSPPSSTPSEPVGPSSASNDDDDDDLRNDSSCRAHKTRRTQNMMSNGDFRRAERAVQRGQAMPLNDVFRSVQSDVNGRLLEVRFDNSTFPPVYQFRMISQNGQLINILSDATSGEILRIVNC